LFFKIIFLDYKGAEITSDYEYCILYGSFNHDVLSGLLSWVYLFCFLSK
jgi:hypothetical protein